MEKNNIKSIIKPRERYTEISSGDMTRVAGVSKETTNSNNIHLAIATIPPGKSSSAHYHINCESAIYVLSGEGIFVAGEKLDKHNIINEGDFIYDPMCGSGTTAEAAKNLNRKCIVNDANEDVIPIVQSRF